MNKIREMNLDIFKENLVKVIDEIKDELKLDIKELKFKVTLSDKNVKINNGIMRLVLLSDKNVGSRLLTLDETVALMASDSPYVPIWVNVSFFEECDGISIFNLETN